MCQFFKKRGYPHSAVTTGKHRAQEIDRETALQTSQNEETNIIPFTFTYHPQKLAIKNVVLKNFKILRNDPETKHIFSLPPLVSFKRDNSLGNFLVRSAFKFENQPATFTCKRTRCKTCPFISNTQLRSQDPIDPLKSLTILHAFPQSVIYCITCTLCKKIYIDETSRRLAYRFCEHLRDVEKTTQMRPNQSRTISIFLITPTTRHGNEYVEYVLLHIHCRALTSSFPTTYCGLTL